MENSENLTQELSKLNQKLANINFSKSRFMIYTANPLKFAAYNFIAGIFHSLGSLFGTLVIAAAIFYIISKIDFAGSISKWIEGIMSQINWDQILPTPQSIDLGNLQIDEKVLQQLQ